MNTYKINITSISRELDSEGLQDIAKLIRYTIIATDSRKVKFEKQDELKLSSPDPSNFVPYFDLTEEQVKKWIEESDQYKENIKELNDILSQAQISSELPWE